MPARRGCFESIPDARTVLDFLFPLLGETNELFVVTGKRADRDRSLTRLGSEDGRAWSSTFRPSIFVATSRKASGCQLLIQQDMILLQDVVPGQARCGHFPDSPKFMYVKFRDSLSSRYSIRWKKEEETKHYRYHVKTKSPQTPTQCNASMFPLSPLCLSVVVSP